MQNPAVQEVELSTAPDENGGTHWGQQVGSLGYKSVFCHCRNLLPAIALVLK